MALSLVAPAVVLMIMLAGAAYRENQDRYQQQLIATTRALAVATDRQIAQGQVTLQALSISPALRSGDYAAFEAQARDAMTGRAAWLVLSDDRRQILNTRAPNGARLPLTSLPEPIWKGLRDGRTTVSNLTTGTLVKQPIIAIDMPVVIEGRLHALSFIQEPAAFESLFTAQHLPDSWTGSIVDRNAMLVARSRDGARMRGRQASPDMRAAMARGNEGVVLSRTLEGTPTLSAFSRSPNYGWTFIVGVPRRELNATAMRSVIGLSMATGALLVIGLLLALVFSLQISRQVRSLAQDAQAISDNEIVETQAEDLAETAQVREALHRASLALRARREEQAAAAGRQNVMINELNHRVKNTLAMVQSLARQSLGRRGDDPLIDTFTERLVALSRAHDLLTERAWQNADLGEVVGRTLELHGRRATSLGPEVSLTPNAAVTLSMVFHELATNAVKYGALSRAEGGVEVHWSVDGPADHRTLTMIWRERGGPFVQAPKPPGFGSRLITASIQHEFGGTAQTEHLPAGLVCTLTVPLSERLTGPPATSPGST
jgi:two-component sensor histidine kinase